MDPGRTAIGTWSGGRFMHFGEPIAEHRLAALLRPGAGIDTVITADVYGEGAADSLLGEALDGIERSSYCLVGAVGHDFHTGEREGAKGFPRFTDPRLRGAGEYASYLRRATEASLERLGSPAFDLLLLHNPDRIGFSSEAVWDGMEALREAGLTRLVGIAPGPANGFTLDLIACFERFGARIDWAMIILNPLEPWPGELCLGAADAAGVRVITRVVDYGGLFWDDVLPGHEFGERDHRGRQPHAAPARLPVEPLTPRHRVRGPDADPGARPGGAGDRGQAGRARGASRAAADRGAGRGHPRDRRQHRIDDAQGRQLRARGTAGTGPLARRRDTARRGAALGNRAGARPAPDGDGRVNPLERFFAWIVTGPVGRFIAFFADLAVYWWRWVTGRSVDRGER